MQLNLKLAIKLFLKLKDSSMVAEIWSPVQKYIYIYSYMYIL